MNYFSWSKQKQASDNNLRRPILSVRGISHKVNIFVSPNDDNYKDLKIPGRAKAANRRLKIDIRVPSVFIAMITSNFIIRLGLNL